MAKIPERLKQIFRSWLPQDAAGTATYAPVVLHKASSWWQHKKIPSSARDD